MSAEARPIPASQFARALEDLPIENIYSKAFEINNSIAHLERSNAQLQDYSDSIKNDASLDAATRAEGDKDCLDAIHENKIVIERQQERVDLLKAEVLRRGGRWHEADANGSKEVANGTAHDPEVRDATTGAPQSRAPPGGRLTDEELRRRMEDRMAQDSDNDEEPGMHL